MSEKINYYGLRKWLIIAGLALVLFVVYFFVRQSIINFHNTLIKYSGLSHPVFKFVLIYSMALVFYYIIARQFVVHGIACFNNTWPFGGRKTVLKLSRMFKINPPLYFAVYLTAFVIWLIKRDTNHLFCLASQIAIFHCMLICIAKHHQEDEDNKKFPDQDLLDSKELAKKITKQVLGSVDDATTKIAEVVTTKKNNTTIALLGPFGSGKTTVVNQVRQDIMDDNSKKANDDHLVCTINGWNLKDGQVPIVILRNLINKVSSVTDTFLFRNIDRDYLQSLGVESKGLLSLVHAFFNSEDSTDDNLLKFNEFLESNRIRVTIIIEDVDRNLNYNEISSEIASLLNRLQMLDRINYILGSRQL